MEPKTILESNVGSVEGQLSRQPARPRSCWIRQNQFLGRKDLIIRMLAEVFHVDQTEDGQVKWRQLSSSLVPVSLYSRTTSKWLNYLLVASSVAASNATNAMSPDSRDFLLLLQQFHHQNHRSSSAVNQLEQSPIVFQVVAHDFSDGKCKKVLNVKLLQPGSRLGQASNHFVYWKDTNVRQPSVAFSSSYCPTSIDLQTWGLNFASVNDAKLFYDICSLNLVDLDFNSDYLKYLATKERSPRAQIYPMQYADQVVPSEMPRHCLVCTRLSRQRSARCGSNDLQTDVHDGARKRSRSTTRKSSDYNSRINQNRDSICRKRSFSTPASPEHPLEEAQPPLICLMHNQSKRTTVDQHHPKCISHLKEKRGLLSGEDRLRATRPEKPARGVLRDLDEAGTRSMQMQTDDADQDMDNNNKLRKQNILDQQVADRFASSHSRQRRYTGYDMISHNKQPFEADLDPTTRPADARLARKLYANSKNMKEFLSLDAGGVQTIPKQLESLHNHKLKAGQHSTKFGVEPDSHNLGAEGAASNDICEPLDATRNASTTTDDLPLDPITKRRMLRLTTSQVQSHESSVPNRSYSSRSDVGRRRSLERAGCVDYDSAQVSKRACCLTPVAQSTSPMDTNPPELPRARQSRTPNSSGSGAGGKRLASFKSAPDIHQVQEPVRLGRVGMSAYAIPLCSNRPAVSDNRARQVHSCPNSLRRRRPCDAESLQDYATPPICRACMRVGASNELPVLQANKQSSHDDKSGTCRRTTQCHQLEVSRSSSACGQAQVARPCSSLSSRSPVHYGLYESDNDESEDCASGGREGRSAQASLEFCGLSFERSASVYIQPESSVPVRGYDQTLSRSSLKSRRRARSQPPALESELDSDGQSGKPASHLAKSMENVQKLIREVQNELDLLQRRSELAADAPRSRRGAAEQKVSLT